MTGPDWFSPANVTFSTVPVIIFGEDALELDGGGTGHVVPVTCVGMIHPGLVGAAIDAGAGEVQIVGCPPGDCANREGNTWLQARLDRTRVPRLKRKYAEAPILTDWVAPDEFLNAVANPGAQPVADPEEKPSFRKMLPVLGIVTVVTLLSIAATNIKYTPGTAGDTVIAAGHGSSARSTDHRVCRYGGEPRRRHRPPGGDRS